MALAAYRHVLRSTRIAFQGTLSHKAGVEHSTLTHAAGDSRILSAARIEARSKFDSNRSLSPDSPGKISEAEEVAIILRRNIVQGQQVKGTGGRDQKYRMYSTTSMCLVIPALRWKWSGRTWTIMLMHWVCADLRIHEEIERGDNESIKTGTILKA